MATKLNKIKFKCGGILQELRDDWGEHVEGYVLEAKDGWIRFASAKISSYPACCGWNIIHDLTVESLSLDDLVLFITSVCKRNHISEGGTGWYQGVTPNTESSQYKIWDKAFEKMGAQAIFKFKNPNTNNELTTWALFIK